MKKYRRLAVLFAAMAVLAVRVECLKATSLTGRFTKLINTTTSSTTTTQEPPVKARLDTVPDNELNDDNSTKIVLTGIPQIDYVWDPNLPRELNGFNLSSYPFLDGMPADEDIGFDCEEKINGFYASIKFGCQLYHHCLYGIRSDFICANFTAFDQKTFICHFASEVDCKNSKKYWNRNDDLYKATTINPKFTTPPPKIDRNIYNRPIGGGLSNGGSKGQANAMAKQNSDAIANGAALNDPVVPATGGGNRMPARPLRRPLRRRRPQIEYYYDDDYEDDYDDRGRRRQQRPRNRRPEYDDDEFDSRRSYSGDKDRDNRRPYNDDFDDYESDRRPLRNRNRQESRRNSSQSDDRRKTDDRRYDSRRPAERERRPFNDDRRVPNDDARDGDDRRLDDRRVNDDRRANDDRRVDERRVNDDRRSNDDRRVNDDDRKVDERRSSGDERRSSGDERRSSGDERRSSGDERRSSGDDRRYNRKKNNDDNNDNRSQERKRENIPYKDEPIVKSTGSVYDRPNAKPASVYDRPNVDANAKPASVFDRPNFDGNQKPASVYDRPLPEANEKPASSVFDRTRAPPKIARPVPLNEKSKFAYTSTEAPRIAAASSNDDEYYDDYDDVPMSSASTSSTTAATTTTTTTTTTQAPTTKGYYKKFKNNNNAPAQSLKVNTDTFYNNGKKVNDFQNVQENEYYDDYDNIKPAKAIQEYTQAPKNKNERASLFNNRNRNNNNDNNSNNNNKNEAPAPVQPSAPSPIENIRMNRFKSSERFVPKSQVQQTTEPEVPTTSAPPIRTNKIVYDRSSQPSGFSTTREDNTFDSKKFATKQTEFESREIQSTTETLRQVYRNVYNPQQERVVEAIVDEKDQRPVVRVVKRPFLPSRGGNPYKARGLQPLGAAAITSKPVSEDRNDEPSYTAPPAFDEVVVPPSSIDYNNQYTKNNNPNQIPSRNTFNSQFQEETTKRASLEDIYNEEYDVEENDALNPTLKPLSQTRGASSSSFSFSSLPADDKRFSAVRRSQQFEPLPAKTTTTSEPVQYEYDESEYEY